MILDGLWSKVGSGEHGSPRLLRYVLVSLAVAAGVFVSVVPLTWPEQLVLGMTTLVSAMWLSRLSKSHLTTLTMMVMSMFATLRYGWWRLSTTFNFFRDPSSKWGALDALFILMLVGAETYSFAILFLGFMQTVRPLHRTPLLLPKDPADWPEVDLLIPSYNEPLAVVRYTALAALNIDWPVDKLHVYILDDGKREEFSQFAFETGIGYRTRDDNKHAKAGNINRALKDLTSPYVAIFDCDHVPTRSFLQVTMQWFDRDPKLAMLQTPHHFYSPDPFERNLGQFRIIPNEGELFYGIVQDGNDFWNATFFCGSCAVLRRTALDEIGGIAVETVTEDAHTSLRMQSNGWNTAYINLPQAAGLATESLSGHIKQRVRWARGMIQILRLDNPLSVPGLRWYQRLCYFNAMTHFMYGLPRLIFLTAPLIYLVFSRTNIPGYWVAILAYAMPHLTLSNMTNARIQGEHRHSFWNEVYETVLSPFILMPTMMALINPKLGKFDVTAKGGVVKQTFFDGRIAQPFVALLLFNFFGLVMAIPRLFHIPGLGWFWDGSRPGTIAMNIVWVLFNIVILGVATTVAREVVQRRVQVRVDLALPAKIKLADGRIIPCTTVDVSSGGAAVSLSESCSLVQGERISVIFSWIRGDEELPATNVACDGKSLRLKFAALSIAEEEILTMILYSRADAWLGWAEAREKDRPLRSLWRIIKISFRGLRDTFVTVARPKKKAGRSGRSVAKTVAPLVVAAALLSGSAVGMRAQPGPRDPTRTAASVTKPATHEDAATTKGYENDLTFRDLGLKSPIELRGIDSSQTISFALPRDQVVEHAVLHLVYRFSPGLISQLSHIKVMMNGTLFATIQADSGGNSEPALDHALTIPAELLARKNQLTFEFIGHYTMTCEDPSNTVLWSRIDASSSLHLSGSSLPLADDLNQLPLPFFDAFLGKAPVIPIVFGASPSLRALQAAGVVTSYFGAAADYRAMRFPVSVGSLPPGNVVLLAEGGRNLPGGLDLGNIGSPTLAVRTNPSDPSGKVLIVSGSDGDQMLIAAQALAMGWNGLQGATASVEEFSLPAKSEADDAPRWEQTRDKVRIWKDLGPEALRSDGSAPVQTFFRIPPDLFYFGTTNLRLHLDYRYNSVPIGPNSSVQVQANDAYLGSIPLIPAKETSKASIGEISVPVVNLRPFSNSLSSNFTFQILKKGNCTDTTPINMQGSIVPTSSLDLRGLPHWAAMPNLELFSNAGFPFTRFADLSQTMVVLPEQPTEQEIELYLTLLGHFGAQTGYPSLRVLLGQSDEMKEGADSDFLVIGTAEDNAGIAKASERLPVTLEGGSLHVKDTAGLLAPVRQLWNQVWDQVREKFGSVASVASGDMILNSVPDGLIEEVESPFAANRTVVVVNMKDSGSFEAFLASFLKTSQSGAVSGSVSVLHGTEFQSFPLSTEAYHVGTLPWWTAANYRLTQMPWAVPIVVMLVAALLARLLQSWLRQRAQARLGGVGK